MTTLNQAEKLVRKITELLGQPAMEAQAAKLAQEFSQLARAASRRLEQCALMIEAGEELQALQLAETPPPLLDLITLLSFRQAGEWRNYCQSHSLPSAEPFFDKYVRLLNTTYGKGIAEDHPYYRDYRRAVMQNDDERALLILRVIARMNPGDKNTAQELQRLEEKTVRARLESLRDIVNSGDTEAVLATLAQLEATSLPIPPSHPVWQQAQLLRCQRLLNHAESLRKQDLWQEAEPVIEEIKGLATQHAVLFPDADVARFEALEDWATEQRGAFAQEQDFQRAFDALEFQVQTTENRRASGAQLAPEQLQAEHDALAAKRREAERFNRPLDADLLRRCQQCSDSLQVQIQQRIKRKRLSLALVSVAALVVLVLAAFFFWDLSQTKRLATQLGQLEAARRVPETRQLLDQIPDRLKQKTPLADAIAHANQFLSREAGQKTAFDQKLGELRALAAGGFSNAFATVESARPECVQLLERLAPAFQTAARSNLESFDVLWQNHLRAVQPGQNATFSEQLAQLQDLVNRRLDPTNGFETVRAALADARARLPNLLSVQKEPIALDAGLLRQFRQVTNAISDCARQVAQWDDVKNRMPHTQTLDGFLSDLALVSESPFASSAERACARQTRSVNPSESSLLGGLLMPAQPQSWAALTNPAPFSLRPTEPSDVEKSAYLKLSHDPNIQDIYLYTLASNPRNQKNAGKTKIIITRGKLTLNKAGEKVGMIYDPDLSRDVLQFKQQAVKEWDWDYSKLDDNSITKESDAFQRLGLNDLIDPNTGNYQKSILELLDRLNRDSGSSAVFRAFLSLHLFEIADLRPSAWALTWSPAASAHLEKLKEFGAANLQSGDWMVLNQLNLYEAPLKKYFEQVKSVSFEQEARYYYKLVTSASQAKFAFAGFVDPNGALVKTRADSGAATEFWGWSARSRAPALLFRNQAKVEDALCYSPVFVFLGDRRHIWEQAAKAAAYPVRSGTNLPPLFNGIL